MLGWILSTAAPLIAIAVVRRTAFLKVTETSNYSEYAAPREGSTLIRNDPRHDQGCQHSKVFMELG